MKIKSTCLIVFLCFYFLCPAQSVQEEMTKRQPECRDVLINASNVLSKLYAEKAFDSIRVTLNIMEEFCSEQFPEVFYITTLLDIQQSSFSLNAFSTTGRFDTLLQAYSFTLKTLTNNGYPINKYQYHFYSPQEKSFYTLVQTWASDLLTKQHLTSSEFFICNTLAGNFKHPHAVLKTGKAQYPELYALLQKNYAHEMSQTNGVLTFMSGIWLPTGKLKIMGTHPSLGFQMGGRGKSNEFDLTLQFRFVNAPGNYYVSRNDSLYTLIHFFGGYIGIDYFTIFFMQPILRRDSPVALAMTDLILPIPQEMTTTRIT
jgi:hypothetical protein